MPEPRTIITALCFDFGTQRIGAAAGQSLTSTATPLPILKARDGIPDWTEIKQLLDQWRPSVVVVGLPLNMDGSPCEFGARAKKFANRIHGRFGVEVVLMDERLSTQAARELERRPNVAVDSLAAALILESWFAGQVKV